MLAREIELVGTPHELARRVNEKNVEAGSHLRVDHRRLQKVAEGSLKVGLTREMLAALDVYFRQKGVSLTGFPMIMTRGIAEPLSESKRLVFMLGAKPRPKERRVDLSRWDAWALAELVRETSRFNRPHEFDIVDILWRDRVDPAAINAEAWYSKLEMDQTSVVSIGSPMASLSSEVMLARMFDVVPFVRPHFSPYSPLPFYFVWHPKAARGFRSAFGLTWEELDKDFGALAKDVRENRCSAFFLNGEPHVVPAEGSSWTMFGVIAAQRRGCGSVWLVISGLAGPATLAAARLVKSITIDLPFSENRVSPVMWAVVKATIKTGTPSSVVSGDVREIVDAQIMGKPAFWTRPETSSAPAA